MALLFSDGFDNYTSGSNLSAAGYGAYLDTLSRTVLNSTGSRWGTPSVQTTGSIDWYTALTTYAFTVGDNSLRVAFWFKVTSAGTNNTAILRLVNSGNTRYCVIRIASNGGVSVAGIGDSGSVSAVLTGNTVINDGQWHHIEVYLVALSSGGSAELWVDGVSEGTFSGATSSSADTATVLSKCELYNPQGYAVFHYDDLVIWDDAGSDFTGYMGPHRTRVLRPSGAGSTTDFTPSTGSNWQNVDEQVLSTTDYNESATAGDIDLYAFGDLSPFPATIKGVALRSVVHNPDVGTKTFRLLAKSDTTTGNGDTFTATASPKVFMTPFGKNPDTDAAWGSELNSAEFGIEVMS